MKQISFVLVIVFCLMDQLMAQNKPVNSRIDLMLLQGAYEKVIDTCKQILAYDSLNPEIHYKMGIAWQNTLEDDLSLNSLKKAVTLNPQIVATILLWQKHIMARGNLRWLSLCLPGSVLWIP
jgi:tetratricopeptide (TPR) repeat protein